MSYDPTLVTGEIATVSSSLRQLLIAWQSTAPVGSAFQVYLDGVLAWSGYGTTCRLPLPSHPVTIDVGAIAPSDLDTDFSALIAPPQSNRPLLTWQGGAYLGASLVAFQVYGSATPGGSVSYTNPLATIPLYDAGIPTDGFGMGGFGMGGFGSAGSTYTYVGDPLPSGVYSFAIVGLNNDGSTSLPMMTTVTLAGPPAPPASNKYGRRLTYTYTQATRVVTLNWLASPGS